MHLWACEQDCDGFVLTERGGTWTDKRARFLCHRLIFRWLEWIQPAELTISGYTNLGGVSFSKILFNLFLFNFKRGKSGKALDVM
jgi:hypothetical protein